MTAEQLPEVFRAMRAFYGAHTDPNPREQVQWQSALAPYPPEVVAAALLGWRRWHGTDPPRPHEIAERCRRAVGRG